MTQFYLEAFEWHGVKRGDAFAFYAGEIRVEGPHPFCSSGGNLGTGRCRTAMYTPRHCRRPAGQDSGRDCADGIHHAKQWRLDHARQKPELTACDTGDNRLAAITLSACLKSPRRQSSAATGRFRMRHSPLSLSVGNRS
jgi:hypothetical protein